MERKALTIAHLIDALIGRDSPITVKAHEVDAHELRGTATLARANKLVDEIEAEVRAMGKKRRR